MWRLDGPQWLAAATHELALGHASKGARRRALTHARRAAGMALNAVLVEQCTRGWPEERCETAWGRSYLDHLRIIAADGAEPLPQEAAELARELLAVPLSQPSGLVPISIRGSNASTDALALAARVVALAREFVAPGESADDGSR